MGTRIVIMNGGEIQQIDAPKALYDRPVNMFVAGFIGSPQMNFLPGTVVEEDGVLQIRLPDGSVLGVSEERERKLKEEGYVGREVVAVPFFISREIPNYVDALFETVSGFTTTGSTILTDIERLSKSLLFWRSFTHFIGGMGVLVFVVAVLPMDRNQGEGSSINILKAEVPGPEFGKLTSRLNVTARILYGIYIVMTAVLVAFLLAGGMSLFDAVTSAFSTAILCHSHIVVEQLSVSVHCRYIMLYYQFYSPLYFY